MNAKVPLVEVLDEFIGKYPFKTVNPLSGMQRFIPSTSRSGTPAPASASGPGGYRSSSHGLLSGHAHEGGEKRMTRTGPGGCPSHNVAHPNIVHRPGLPSSCSKVSRTYCWNFPASPFPTQMQEVGIPR
jgi:hypothetical protein